MSLPFPFPGRGKEYSHRRNGQCCPLKLSQYKFWDTYLCFQGWSVSVYSCWKMFVSWGLGEGGGLFQRPPGEVASWGRCSSKIYPGPRGCPRDGPWVLKSNIATRGCHLPGSSDQSSLWAFWSASALLCVRAVGRPSGGCWVQVLSLSCAGVSISRNSLVHILALMVHKEDISVWDANFKR